MTRTPLPKVFVAACYGAITLVGWAAFRRYPDQSVLAWIQFGALYLATVAYPIVWRLQHLRVLRRLGVAAEPDLRAYSWAPVVVGGTGFLIALGLLARR